MTTFVTRSRGPFSLAQAISFGFGPRRALLRQAGWSDGITKH